MNGTTYYNRTGLPAPVKASVVIPVYNAERYLDECIRSALDQTHRDAEIVAVNDGSTDASPEILDAYADRISVYHKPNGGTASALNHGIRRMGGDWFKWHSADDLLKPHALETLCGAAERLGERSIKYILYAEHDFIDEHGKQITTLEDSEHDFIDEHGKQITTLECLAFDYNRMNDFERNVRLLNHFYGPAGAAILHRSAFDECGFFSESLPFSEDYEFWLRCCLLHGYRLYYVPGNVGSYRMHTGQLSNTRRPEFVENGERIRSSVLSKLPPDLRRRYVAAEKNYSPYPRHVRIRRGIRDAVLGALPQDAADRAVALYLRAAGKCPGEPRR